jgi:hypothetical protein
VTEKMEHATGPDDLWTVAIEPGAVAHGAIEPVAVAPDDGASETVAIAPGAELVPTVPDVSADLAATMYVTTDVASTVTTYVTTDVASTVTTNVVDTPTEPVGTQALTGEEVPGTLLLTTPVDPSQGSVPAEYRRVGPGVPAAAGTPSASGIDPATAAAWHGTRAPKPRRALLRGWLLPLAVLVGVIALLLWQHVGGRLTVVGAAASPGTPSIGCDSTEVVTATLRTNGSAGTIVYRWIRSDGTVSDELRQTVGDGTKQVDVVLRWAFSGHGSMRALATIDVENPGTASAVASFSYSCP